MALSPIELKAVRDMESAVTWLHQLGYGAEAHTIDTESVNFGSYRDNRVLKSDSGVSDGYGVFVGELDEAPRSFAKMAEAWVGRVHDYPLGVIGIRGERGPWRRLFLVRPRLVTSGGKPGWRVSKAEIDLSAPTAHDAEVADRIRWRADDDHPQARVDAAFDIEAVTRRFFDGLQGHFRSLEAAVEADAANHSSVRHRVESAGGSKRVAIRIVSQVLFCWFLQRRGLLARDPNYLITRFRLRVPGQPYYSSELEPLFYDTLGVPVADRGADRPGPEVPFLNGGLFQRLYGTVSLNLPDGLFSPQDGLLGYLSRWTFTLSEESPNEADVAVDPELLGRIFEHLISDEEQSRHGVVYTPRPVVQFMCREALAPWLESTLGVAPPLSRRLVTDDDVFTDLNRDEGTAAAVDLAKRLGACLDDLTVLDPAVGSGAFLLGMMAEIVRLRSLAYRELEEQDPPPHVIHEWKLGCIESTLFGVDIEPLALELCRLRLWLSLMIDAPERDVPPLPNLDYRTVAADALTDFVGGSPVQNTRGGATYLGLTEATETERRRREFLRAAAPKEKEAARQAIRDDERHLVENLLGLVAQTAHPAQGDHIRAMADRFLGPDRRFPVFMPAFHAPEVWGAGGWDIVIMNPPYLGKKEVARKVDSSTRSDYVLHHGEANDLMILFAARAAQLLRPNGIGSIILQDSVLTSADGESLRRRLIDRASLRVICRTRCFEGQAVNGAVLVWRNADPDRGVIRWVEGYGRDPRLLAAASAPDAEMGEPPTEAADRVEVFEVGADRYAVIPSRPLFRPAPAALTVLDAFRAMQPSDIHDAVRFRMLSQTKRLRAAVDARRRDGWFDRLQPGTFVPLGYCIVGGQGLATADDKRFLAAIEGTDEAKRCITQQHQLVAQIATGICSPALRLAASRWGSENPCGAGRHSDTWHASVEEWLISVLDLPDASQIAWPRLFRVAPLAGLADVELTSEIRRSGIVGPRCFVPFEKGDQSGETDDGRAAGARWWRENQIAIDWSADAVSLLRSRAAAETAHRKPYFRNEDDWGLGGVTWNGVASYMRTRLVPRHAIFGHMAATVRSSVSWMDDLALAALLNSDTVDFILRTFLGSRMHIEIGDVRRVPVPVLGPQTLAHLCVLGRAALDATQKRNRSKLAQIQEEVNVTVRSLYGLSGEARLWVVR